MALYTSLLHCTTKCNEIDFIIEELTDIWLLNYVTFVCFFIFFFRGRELLHATCIFQKIAIALKKGVGWGGGGKGTVKSSRQAAGCEHVCCYWLVYLKGRMVY